MSNIFLFTGEEIYLLEKELHRWIDAFAVKHGADAVRMFDSENFDVSAIQNSVFAGGLFVTKNLVIIKGLPQDTKPIILSDDLHAVYNMFLQADFSVPDSTLLVFVNAKPDKRTAFYKKLKNIAQVKVFSPLKGVQLTVFVKEQLAGLKVDTQTIDYLILQVGNDLYRLSHECAKLHAWCLWTHANTVSQQLIDTVVYGQVHANVFSFFDFLLSEPDKACAVLDSIRDSGTQWIQCAGALYRWLKSHLFTLDYVQHGIRDAKVIAQETSLPPFSIARLLTKITQLQAHAASLVKLYKWLVDTDVAIRTGQLPDVGFWLKMKQIVYSIHSEHVQK